MRSTFGKRSARRDHERARRRERSRRPLQLAERWRSCRRKIRRRCRSSAADVRRVAWVDRHHGDPRSRGARERGARDTSPSRAAGLVSTGYLETQAGATAVANTKGLFAYNRQTALCADDHRAHRGRNRIGLGRRDEPRLREARSEGPRRARDREGARSVNPVAIEPGRYTVDSRADGRRQSRSVHRDRAERAQRRRRPQLLLEAGRREQDRQEGRRRARHAHLRSARSRGVRATRSRTMAYRSSKTTWIENGVVKKLSYDRFWAQKQGKAADADDVGRCACPAALATHRGADRVDTSAAFSSRASGTCARSIRARFSTRASRATARSSSRTARSRRRSRIALQRVAAVHAEQPRGAGPPVRVSASEAGGPGLAIVVPPIKVRDFNFTSLSDAV